jgi:hypothetical protein
VPLEDIMIKDYVIHSTDSDLYDLRCVIPGAHPDVEGVSPGALGDEIARLRADGWTVSATARKIARLRAAGADVSLIRVM